MSTADARALRELAGHLHRLATRDQGRAALLRQAGFQELARAYDEGGAWATDTLRRLRPGEGPSRCDDSIDASLPNQGRMRALMRLVRGDMAENRKVARALERLADGTSEAADDLRTAATRVKQQSDQLNTELRQRLTDWSRRA